MKRLREWIVSVRLRVAVWLVGSHILAVNLRLTEGMIDCRGLPEWQRAAFYGVHVKYSRGATVHFDGEDSNASR